MTDDALFDDDPFYEPLVRKGDARHLDLADESVDCIVTSPPYNLGVEYEGYVDNVAWQVYVHLAEAACLEMARVIKPSGRIWINVMPSIPMPDTAERFPLSEIWSTALRNAELHYRDTVTWIQDSHDAACAWGSWEQPSAPNLRGSFEVILNYFKPPYKRTVPPELKGYRDKGLEPKVTGQKGEEVGWRSDWPTLCRNVWKINPVRRRPDAPAPFPDELVRRAVRLSTWPGQVVMDPFAGSGTTPRVAREMGRVGIGFDLDAN